MKQLFNSKDFKLSDKIGAVIVFLIATVIVVILANEIPKNLKQTKEKYHFTTEKGLECVGPLSAPSCNWEAWNLKTNYGMYPEKEIK